MTTTLSLPGRPTEITVPALLLRNAEDHPELPALSWRSADGWTTLTWAETRIRVLELAAGFAALGVGRGDHVLLKMPNSPEHWLSDLALVHLGAVPVSVYGTASLDQIAYISRHSRARLAVVETQAEADRWKPMLSGNTRLERLVVVGGGAPFLSFTEVSGDPATVEDSWRASATRDPLTVVYTSGTTGEPKAVLITQHSALRQAVALDRLTAALLPPHVEHICYLPFAHVVERMLGIYLSLLRASHIRLCADPAKLAPTIRELRPRELFGVPRIWEKLAAAVRAGLAALPAEQREAVERAQAVALDHLDRLDRGEQSPPELAERYAELKERVLTPLLARYGLDRMVWAVIGGSPVQVDLLRFWASLGIVLNNTWGLTETSGGATISAPDAFRLGAAGRPLDGLEMRCAPDGEILVRGESLAAGYLRADGSVKPFVDTDGWFATGDIGRIDGDGYVWISDRKKELIVTSTGKNVSPTLVEGALTAHPLVGQALAYGDNRSYLVALLVLDPETTLAWAAARSITGTLAELAVHREVLAEIDEAVEAANTRLSRSEQIKRYRLLAEEWTPTGGELTPTMKIRRRVLVEKYAQTIELLYAQS